MEKQLKRVCGADIHKKFLIATILDRDGNKLTQRFGMTMDELLKFKIWVISNGCEQVAVESTGSYWVPIYSVLEGYVGLIVANAYKIKHTPGRKTDFSDSEWIAELCLNGMIEPSRIFPKKIENFECLQELVKATWMTCRKRKTGFTILLNPAVSSYLRSFQMCLERQVVIF